MARRAGFFFANHGSWAAELQEKWAQAEDDLADPAPVGSGCGSSWRGHGLGLSWTHSLLGQNQAFWLSGSILFRHIDGLGG